MIISKTKTRKLREANNNIARNCGYKFTITTKGKEKKRRNISNLNLTIHFVSDTNLFKAKPKKISSLITTHKLIDLQESDGSYNIRKLEGICIAKNAFDSAEHILMHYNEDNIASTVIKKEKDKTTVVKKENKPPEKDQAKYEDHEVDEEDQEDEDEDEDQAEDEEQTDEEDELSPVRTHTGKRKHLHKLNKKKKAKIIQFNDSDFEDNSVFEGSQDVSKLIHPPQSPLLTRNQKKTINAAEKAALNAIQECGITFKKKLEENKTAEEWQQITKVNSLSIFIPILFIF